METAIRGAFGETAAGLLKFRDRECPSADPGTTATVLLRFPGIGVNVDDDQPEYYLAHVGDSPCFLVSSTGHMHLLNPAHNATNPSEVARVTALGGKFFAPPNANANAPAKEREGPTERLQGYLACSRAIGDFGYRPCITSDPEILKFTTSGIPCPEDKGTWKFILLCSDGVSDFLGPALLGSVLLKGYKKGGEGYYYSGAEAAAREIVREAVKRGGWDNASCIVVEI